MTMSEPSRYEILAFDLDAHEFVLQLVVPPTPLPALTLSLPAWLPGSYMIRDFARHVAAIAAVDREGPVAVQKLDKQTWRVDGYEGELVLQYRVYAYDLSVRGAYLDRTRAYFNGACVFLRVEERADAPWQVSLPRPRSSLAQGWEVATTLPVRDVDDFGFGLYAGKGYDDLIDHPVEVGEWVSFQKRVCGDLDAATAGFPDNARRDIYRYSCVEPNRHALGETLATLQPGQIDDLCTHAISLEFFGRFQA